MHEIQMYLKVLVNSAFENIYLVKTIQRCIDRRPPVSLSQGIKGHVESMLQYKLNSAVKTSVEAPHRGQQLGLKFADWTNRLRRLYDSGQDSRVSLSTMHRLTFRIRLRLQQEN
jgi:hypothetical protein